MPRPTPKSVRPGLAFLGEQPARLISTRVSQATLDDIADDPIGWVLGDAYVQVYCGHTGYPALRDGEDRPVTSPTFRENEHRLRLTPDGPAAPAHGIAPQEWNAQGELFMAALAGQISTCALTAARLAGHLVPLDVHAAHFRSSGRSTWRAVAALHAGRAWVAEQVPPGRRRGDGWAPSFDADTLTLIRDGVTPQAWRTYQAAGFSVKDAARLTDTGFTPARATQWRDRGYTVPQMLTAAKTTPLLAPTAADADVTAALNAWSAAGFSRSTGLAWMATGLDIPTARALADAGYPAKVGAEALQHAPLDLAIRYGQAGIMKKRADTAWITTFKDDVDEAVRWAQDGYPATAVLRAQASASAELLRRLTLEEARAWAAVGITDIRQVPKLIASPDASPHRFAAWGGVTLPDGERLHEAHQVALFLAGISVARWDAFVAPLRDDPRWHPDTWNAHQKARGSGPWGFQQNRDWLVQSLVQCAEHGMGPQAMAAFVDASRRATTDLPEIGWAAVTYKLLGNADALAFYRDGHVHPSLVARWVDRRALALT